MILGFKIAFTDTIDATRYTGMIRDGIEIHLQWHDEKEWILGLDRPMLRICVDHIEEIYEEYSLYNVFHEKTSLKETSWRTQEFAFYDLYRNGLIFYKDI